MMRFKGFILRSPNTIFFFILTITFLQDIRNLITLQAERGKAEGVPS
jgi:hypothetical protein